MFLKSPRENTSLVCPNCDHRNYYSFKDDVKASAFGYYTCKHCGAEYDSCGLIDTQNERDYKNGREEY